MGIELNNEQIFALYKLEHWWHESTNQVFQISGYGGTGKTTLVRYLIERIGLTYKDVLFVAFMGKATSVLTRMGLPAKTIHSTIYDYEKVLARDENNKIIFNDKGKPKLIGKFVKKEKLDKKIKLIVLDEGSMVDEKTGLDLLSFGIPTIVLGDLNQLPPVFGKPFFLQDPDVTLTEIMRQAEGNPIIYLEQQVLNDKPLKIGVYGNSAVIGKNDIDEYYFRESDIVLTETNLLRYNINQYYRESLKKIVKLDYPHIGEKVMCRKNNWDKCVSGIYLTNGLTGFVDNIYRDSFNGKTMTMDFRPDFMDKCFKNVTFDYHHMYEVPGQENLTNEYVEKYNDKMEYAYAITTHSSQGSQYNKVLYMNENMMRTKEDRKRLMYTAISRAIEKIVIVI